MKRQYLKQKEIMLLCGLPPIARIVNTPLRRKRRYRERVSAFVPTNVDTRLVGVPPVTRTASRVFFEFVLSVL